MAARKRAEAFTPTLSSTARQGGTNINPRKMDMTMTSNNTNAPQGAIIDGPAVLNAIQTEKARRATARNRTVTTGDLINIMDILGTAKTRCAALHMASEALVPDHRDAVSWLANDCDDVINRAIEALGAIKDTAEGTAHA